jgi:UPF0042 nucleotide-binding protein
MRFLRNPHYDPILRPKTGLDPDVAAYVASDPDFEPTVSKITDLLRLLLPRFVDEGKKYVNIAIGCTGGRHRSVYMVQRLAVWLDGLCGEGTTRSEQASSPPWRVMVNHRELNRAEPQERFKRDEETAGVADALRGDEGLIRAEAARVAIDKTRGAGLTMPAQAQEA